MNKICFGCGVKLQSLDSSMPGYVPASKTNSDYCQRCFRLMHYGIESENLVPKSTEEIINTVNKDAKFAVFMVDFIDIFDTVMNIYSKIKVPKILVVSKSDIIPKNVSYETIKRYLRKIYKVKDEIIFTSIKSSLNSLVKSLYDKDEVYFLGLSNSGKSSLINLLLKKAKEDKVPLTTNYKKNTTQDFIRVNILGKTYIDSPGFVIESLENDSKERIESEIKPIVYQNKTACTYKIGDNLSINIKGRASVVFYFSKNLKVTREYNKQIIGMSFTVKGNSDIVISGLGFIKITEDATVIIPMDMMKYINIRPSLTGGKYE